MNKKIKFFFIILTLIIFSGCSFDNKTGIWKDAQKEKQRASDLEKEQEKIKKIRIFSTDTDNIKELAVTQNVILSNPKKIYEWKMPGLNLQNSVTNIHLPSIENRFLKKKVGKNKFLISKVSSGPLVFNESIIITDDTGSIFSIKKNGKKNWKRNIYKKVYKKVYKNLSTFIHKDKIFVADNIGFIYSINLDNGRIEWIKNHGIPFKSNIKVFDGKIFVINQDNRLISFDVKDGSKLWDIRSISSFIKSQYFLGLGISKKGNIVTLGSSGELLFIDSTSGNVIWSQNVTDAVSSYSKDFFKSSDILIDDENIIFSTSSKVYSFNLYNGYLNWQQEVRSVNTPIVDGRNIFLVSENGFFICLNKKSGEIIYSVNVIKSLKKRKQETFVTGFILGSGNMYIATLNGFLIVSSANSGSVKYIKKIGNIITAPLVIADSSLYVLTENSTIFGFN